MRRCVLFAWVLLAGCASSRPAPLEPVPGVSLRPRPAPPVTRDAAKEGPDSTVPKEVAHDELTHAAVVLASLEDQVPRYADDDAALVLHSLRVALQARGVEGAAPASRALAHAAEGFEQIPSAGDRCRRIRVALTLALDTIVARDLASADSLRIARHAVAPIDDSLPYELQHGPVRRALEAVVLALRSGR